jgi:glycosyltransferase involved in cell wall biosynthesis
VNGKIAPKSIVIGVADPIPLRGRRNRRPRQSEQFAMLPGFVPPAYNQRDQCEQGRSIRFKRELVGSATSVPDPQVFKSARDFAAWLGLVPRQNSTGGEKKTLANQGRPHMAQRAIARGASMPIVGDLRLRILFTLPVLYPPQSRAGTASNTHELCIALQRYGHSVAVLAAISRRTWFGISNRARCRVRLSHCCPPDKVCGYPVFRSHYSDLRKSLEEVLVYFRPDVVITQLHGSLNLAQQAYSRGIPAVSYIHDISSLLSDVSLLHNIGEPTKNRFRFLSNSEFTARQLRDLIGTESTVVRNLFHPERYRAELLGEQVTFVNPHTLKGADTAFSLAERCPNIPFMFVGSWLGPPEKRYMRRAKATPNIYWAPSTPDMRNIYGKTRILIVPSRVDETWGRVVTEAQFSGIPVLASDRGGLPESVGRGGALLPADDLDGWQIALEDLWYNNQLWGQLSARALQHAARSEIQPSKIIEQFLDFLEQVRMKERVEIPCEVITHPLFRRGNQDENRD